MTIPPLELDYKPRIPPRADFGIGIVGCGGIVNYAHLPAYKAHGLRVLACYDASADAARKTAADHAIPTVYESLDALLADDAIQIVDIAVPAWHQRAIAERALQSGKHLLCQKPLAESLVDARAIVAAGRRAGRVVAVNQQMRWSPGIAAA
ncbi:MAG: Gfo/Idh/MocA family oxidoreductase, partial [Chloroflexales bacterium]|nr:Gfo/Idh/MocA family oxidoreductase [Chloroflexales bacterium]